jgi:SNF2 family DNA or RNA helicase
LYLRRTMKKELPHLQFSDPELVDVHDAPDAIKGFQSGLVEKVVDSKGNEMIGEMVRRSLMEVALFKAPKTATFANEIVDKFPGDKIIILTERIACAELMFSALSGMLAKGAVVLHHGRLSDAERKAAIDSFSESSDGGPQILVSTRPSVGVGINLQCANRVIFNDLPWTPADILQASARVKRLNQPKEVFEYWLLSDTVFDTNLMKILMKKLTLIRQYAEGQNISEEDQKWMHQRVTLEDIFYGMDKGKDISGEIMGKG